MTDKTIVTIYDTAPRAEAAVRDLLARYVPPSAISQHADTTELPAGTTAQPPREQGFMISRTSALSFRNQIRRHHIHLRTGSYSGH